MPDTQLAVDVSNFQGAISVDTFRQMRAEGAQRIICGTDGSPSFPVAFPQQVANAREAGLAVEAYIYLYFSQPLEALLRRVNIKLDMIEASGVAMVWLDCEDTTSGLDPETLVGTIAAARDEVRNRGHGVGIYTGSWWWKPYTNNSEGFYDLPLWVASYDGNTNIEIAPLGGWSEAWRKQFTDKGLLAGIQPLDLNIERRDPAAPPGISDEARAAFTYVQGWANSALIGQSVKLAIEQMRLWTDEADRLTKDVP